ncbi:MAG TPA: secretin N-terminal domain-containing protein [Thermoanaerobaculia bacterium]|nr:secretin N-terminal domain-containing protein [Thermoanaerobaculia bacterium]
MRMGLGPIGFRGLAAFVAVTLLVTGCTGFRAARRAEIASQTGNWDEAVLYWAQALDQEPTNIGYQGSLLRARVRAAQQHFERGKEFHAAGVLERALVEYQQAVQLDPSNQYAQVELRRVRDEVEAARLGTTVETIAEMKRRSQGIRPQPPMLNPRSDEPISLEFPEPVPITSIYRSLGKAFGLNILFDPGLRDADLSIVLKDVTAQDALEILMRSAGHFYKVLDPQTIIIAADTPQNRRNYEDLVIQAFFLSNADVKDALTILRSLIGARQIAMNEQLNAIIIRDTADKVKVAEKIIETIDKAKAEVVIDVELLQLSSNRIRDLGAQLSTYSVTQSLDLGSPDAALRVSDLEFLNQSNWALTIPNVVYNFVKSDTDAQLLAEPKLRISEGEKGRLVIGDRVPVPVTSFNTANTVGGNIVPITSFQYQDVGITISIEPRVHHNKEVTLKLTVEISQVTGQVSAGSGQAPQPIIGTRTIESTIRLKDGETNLLAGLIRRDDTATDSGMPGLSDIPVLGRLFSKNSTENRRTDVILTLTPHIVRLPDITETDLLPIWVGTEQNITFRGGSPRVESDVEGPFDGPDAASPEEIRERIRERLQSLPRGLQGEEAIEGGQAPIAPGQELVPGLPPPSGSIFEEEEEPEEELFAPELLEEEPPAVSFRRNDAEPGGDLDLVIDELMTDTTALASATDEAGAFWRFAAVTASPLATATDVELRMVPVEVRVAPGDAFELAIEARALAPVSHLPLTLLFDPAVLAVERVEPGSFLGGPGAAEVLSDRSAPGRLVLGASRLGESVGVAGEGVVVRVVFRALAPGSAGLRFEAARALDSALAPLALETRPAAVEVGGERPPAAPVRPERPAERPPVEASMKASKT